MEQSSHDASPSHYSFGDNPLAAVRLEHLAAAFASSSRRFLQGAKPGRVELALDLGSGLGATTALLRDVTNAPRVVGYERSANFLVMARRQYPEFAFRDVDALSPAYPDREADLIARGRGQTLGFRAGESVHAARGPLREIQSTRPPLR